MFLRKLGRGRKRKQKIIKPGFCILNRLTEVLEMSQKIASEIPQSQGEQRDTAGLSGWQVGDIAGPAPKSNRMKMVDGAHLLMHL